MAEFVHLHVHSHFSLLDGLSSPKALVERAVELGMPALAITDHGALYGVVEFYQAASGAGIKPIIGIETYLARRGLRDRDAEDRKPYHLALLAQDNAGYKNLLKLASVAMLDGFYYKPRIDKDLLAAHSDGVIVLSGCGSSEIPRLLRDGRVEDARAAVAWYRERFPGRFFIELQDHDIPEMKPVNRQLIEFARQFDLPLVATNDVHYARREQAQAHDVLLAIGTGKSLRDPSRMRMDGDTYYMRSAEEMAHLFPDTPEALTNTLRVAEMCDVTLEIGRYHLPVFEVPAGQTPQSYLRALCEEGLRRRYGARANDPEVRARLEHELAIIHEMGFDAYFLIVWDLCRAARERDIWYNARGSAAGSIVAYALGITMVDPLANGLIFERFLNPGRISMPDIDMDFQDDRRGELIEYTVRKYGRDNVAQIITFGTLGARAAVRDVGRVMDIPLSEVDRVAKLIPNVPGKPVTIAQALEQVPELQELYKTTPYVRQMLDTASQLEGVARHASTHAAGVVISDAPLVEYCPLSRPPKGEVAAGDDAVLSAVTQWAMEDLEAIGLLKVDYLGLTTLTIMRRACDLIRQRHGVSLDLDTIPLDDPAIYRLLASGDVAGLFQVEGSGLRRVLQEMRPTRYEHIVAVLALYRPGPMEYIPTFIQRMHGQEKVAYRHPALAPILDETFGICISGDAIVYDARTGAPHRLDELGEVPDLYVQGLDDMWQTAVGRVTHLIANGRKPVWQVTLRNGSQIKLTADHLLLTETGWTPLAALNKGDFVATPPELVSQTASFDRRKLRVLAYLIADGDIGNLSAVNFVSKNPLLLAEYQRCLKAFDNLRVTTTAQARGVSRIGVAKDQVDHYREPNDLLRWLRELGLKHPPGQGGCRAAVKFVPPFVFGLDPDDIAWFLASLWDCDGHVNPHFAHYRTISERLAFDVQSLLLKLGIPSNIYRARYGDRISYQVTVYQSEPFASRVQRQMITDKRLVPFQSKSTATISRPLFVQELEGATAIPKRRLQKEYGIDRQHFTPRGRRRPRIPAYVVAGVADALGLEATQRRLRLNWQEIIDITPVDPEDVYDLTVEGLHNFVANNIIVHNCVYQEQIIRIATDLAGYTASEADLLRRAVAKKKKTELLSHRTKFVGGALARGIPEQTATEIFDDFEYFARYGFNKSHAADYAVLTCQTAYLKAHYPVEYMTALLTVERNNTEKVGAVVTECRRMGIEVLPPCVQRSALDFIIEELSAGRLAIRFGLGAVKNVGDGPVETILQARAEGPFRDLGDFCRRVDLRVVNRRALESLIRVGALSAFGPRARLLAALDRLMGLSARVHQARESGQLSLFGESTGVAVDDDKALFAGLPPVAEAPQRDLLAWEKELAGAYLSENPLVEALRELGDAITANAGQLQDERPDQVVTVLGQVRRVRRHTARSGEEMAFVTLEDLYGTCDVVVFPRLWATTKERWLPDQLVVVCGKVNFRGEQVSLVCDWVKSPAEVTRPRPAQAARPVAPARPAPSPEPFPSPGRTVQVTIRRSGDARQDFNLLCAVHEMLVACPGQDRFTFLLQGGPQGDELLEFPNASTGYCRELGEKLAELLGPGMVSVREGVGM